MEFRPLRKNRLEELYKLFGIYESPVWRQALTCASVAL